MTKIKIVTDSTACLGAGYLLEHDIAVSQLAYTFEGETINEGTPEEWDGFYKRFAASKDFPKTSQAVMHGFFSAFERALKQEGYDYVLCMTISSKVSGTYSSAMTAAKMVDPARIFVVDSMGGGSSLKMLVEDTVQRIAEGLPMQRVYEMALFDASHTQYQFTAATLEYLRRGGRISSAMAMLGGVLKILPLIELIEGAMVVAEKIRGGEMKVIDKMIAKMPERVRKIGISHVLAPDLAGSVAERLRGIYPEAPIDITQMNPVIGCHLGPGALGIATLFE
jgi:DegV family protein with EDD domain